MRALVVFESMWGNTEEVARAVGRGLGTDVPCWDVAREECRDLDLSGVELLVVGGPTHAFSMSRASTRQDALAKGARAGHQERGIREWLEALPEGGARRIATFDTRVEKVRRLPGSAARKAAKHVRRHRLGRLVDEQSFYVEDMAGPLVEGEVARAEAWGRALAGVTV